MIKSSGDTAHQRKHGEKTREEYLAGSLSRLQPWVAEGISRPTYYRRLRNPAGTKAKADASPVAVANPALEKTRAQPHRTSSNNVRTDSRANDSLWAGANGLNFVRRVDAALEANGQNRTDAKALVKAITDALPQLPADYRQLQDQTLLRGYYRAEERRPSAYERWLSLVQSWDKSYGREKARDLIDRLIKVTEGFRLTHLDELFSHAERRICWDGNLPNKVKWLEHECDRLAKNELYWPTLKPLLPDAFAEEVCVELRRGPRSKKQLMHKFKKTYSAISSVGVRMRKSGRIVTSDAMVW